MKFDKYMISDTQLIEHAIEIIELNSTRCVIVTNAANKAIGMVSEGDILRAILKGISIKSPVKQIMNTRFRSLSDRDDARIKLLFKSGITLIPILNNNNELIDVVDLITYFQENEL